MHNEIFNLLRATLLGLLIGTITVLCITDDSRHYPQHTDPTIADDPVETTPR